jgi:Fe-S cluster assembly protein SufD
LDLTDPSPLRNDIRERAGLDPTAEEQGVRLLDLAAAVRGNSPLSDLVRRYLGQVVRPHEEKLTALHYAFLNAGVVLHVPRGVRLAEPVEIAFDVPSSGPDAFAHTLVVVEDGAEVSVVQRFSSEPRGGSPLATAVVETVVGAHARLRYLAIQDWGDDVWNFSWQRSRLGSQAHLRTLNAVVGGRYGRNTIQVHLDGAGAEADLLGVVAAKGRQHVDFQTLQEHVGSDTRSDLVIHNALFGRSSTNFTGLIRIDKQARQTESSQEQKNVLLSPQAKADSDPKLEILNNDVVRCTHGAAVGPVDPETIYYLQTRGLPHDEAEALVLEGFYQTVLERLEQPGLQVRAWEALEARLKE